MLVGSPKTSPLSKRAADRMTDGGVMPMTRIPQPLLAVVMSVPLLHSSTFAAPQNQWSPQTRTYVSAQGIDANGCVVTAPCRTLQAALALTVAGGEIFVLNSANYGAVTINKAVTITSEGAIAGVLATSGTGIQ